MTAAKTKPRANGAKPNREQRRRFVRSRFTTTKFEDGEFEGLEVRTKRVSIDELFEITLRAADLPDDVAAMSDEQIGMTKELLAQFAGFLVSWNLDEPVLGDDGEETDESEPVPATYEGLMSQDFGFVFTLFTSWTEALGDVAGPLDPTSSGGVPSAVPPLPMDELSANQQS